jgi:hypothetical protein
VDLLDALGAARRHRATETRNGDGAARNGERRRRRLGVSFVARERGIAARATRASQEKTMANDSKTTV